GIASEGLQRRQVGASLEASAEQGQETVRTGTLPSIPRAGQERRSLHDQSRDDVTSRVIRATAVSQDGIVPDTAPGNYDPAVRIRSPAPGTVFAATSGESASRQSSSVDALARCWRKHDRPPLRPLHATTKDRRCGMNEAKLHEFMGKVVTDMGGAWMMAAVLIGDELGLYKAMADGISVT